MKILKLTTFNIASLEGENIIDFTIAPLNDCRIFSIVGPTGSGKSTILDAICLSLYGKAPRYNVTMTNSQKKEEGDGKSVLRSNDPRNIMTRGTKSSYCHLIFEANDRKMYQAEWSVELKVKNYTDAQNRLFRVNINTKGNYEIIGSSLPFKAENIIGLQYEQFVRTVLLAQGAFDGFLKADTDEKSMLLEKITGIEIYKRIAEKIRIHYEDAQQRNKEITSMIGARKEQLIEDEDELNALKTNINNANIALTEIKKESEIIETQLIWWSTFEKLTSDLNTSKIRKEHADIVLQSLSEQKDRLSLYDMAAKAIAFIKEKAIAIKDAERFTTNSETARKQEEELSKQIYKDNCLLDILIKKESDIISSKNEITPKIQVARSIQAELENIKTIVKELTATEKTNKRSLNTIDEDIKNSNELLTKLNKQSELSVINLEKRKESHLKELKDEEIKVKKFKEELKSLEDKIKDVDGTKLQRMRDLAFMINDIGDQAILLRKQLVEGDKCPICGSTYHDDKSQDTISLKDYLNEVTIDFLEKDKALSDYKATNDQIQRLQKIINNSTDAITSIKERQAKDIEKLLNGINQLNNDISALKAAIKGLEQQKEDKTILWADSERKLNETKRLYAEKNNALLKLFNGRNADDVEKEFNDATQKATKAVNEQKEIIAKLQSASASAHSAAESNIKEAERCHSHEEELNKEIDNWLKCYNSTNTDRMLTEEELQTLSTEQTDWNALRLKINNVLQEVAASRELFHKIEKDLEEHKKSKPNDDRSQLLNKKQTITEKLKDLTKNYVNLSALLKNHNDAEEALGELVKESIIANTDVKDWSMLYKAVGGNKDGKLLRQIAQCTTLSFLVNHANKQLRLFNKRYSLRQIENTLTLRIIDHDRGDEERVISSLSGGETFIMSLALALALSDLSSKNVAFKNLFIDEGFGTLDHDSLRMVIDALATLQSEQGKTVGVISHTVEMSSGIYTQICIMPQGNGCSKLSVGNQI